LNGICRFDARHLSLRVPAAPPEPACLTADSEPFAVADQDGGHKLGSERYLIPVSDHMRSRLLRYAAKARTGPWQGRPPN
jgi:hypothetical protein